MYLPDLVGPGLVAADTPFDINERLTVLQELQQFCDVNSSASAATLGIRDFPSTSTGWIPKVGVLVHEKIVVKKEFSPSYRAPVQVLGIEGPPLNVTGEEVPATTSTPPPPEEAHSDDSSSARLDHDDQPGPSGTQADSRLPSHSPNPPQSLPPQETPPQHPPIGPILLSPGHGNQLCVHHYREPRQPHKHRTIRDLGSVAVGTRFRGQRHREAGRTAVRQGEDRPREPTLHKALTNIVEAYHYSQETMGQILAKLQETQQLQEGQYLGIREDLRDIHTTVVTIAGVLADMANTMR
ncbi:hypothetical protein NDU88_005233 [Pleurodeles waltl]|uniref:Uncharacterized protein n=1 Tax=Pleurodeles waltl TaxID=8319 RepID=A0AAV7MXR5_PLEWA|nr:hypothetical protein NDU88_005233 [Pleurodeles waltl]